MAQLSRWQLSQLAIEQLGIECSFDQYRGDSRDYERGAIKAFNGVKPFLIESLRNWGDNALSNESIADIFRMTMLTCEEEGEQYGGATSGGAYEGAAMCFITPNLGCNLNDLSSLEEWIEKHSEQEK